MHCISDQVAISGQLFLATVFEWPLFGQDRMELFILSQHKMVAISEVHCICQIVNSRYPQQHNNNIDNKICCS